MQASKDTHNSKVNENKMNNHESEQVNYKEQEPQLSIEFNGSVFQLPLSVFDNILDCEITGYILNNKTDKKDIIDLELINDVCWKTKYKQLKNQYNEFQSIIGRLEKDLKTDKFAQPCRINSRIKQTGVKIRRRINVSNKVNTRGISNKKHEIISISDSDDDVIFVTEMSKNKPIQMKNENIIDLTDNDNTKKIMVKNKPGLKSKINVSKPGVKKINGYNKVLPINTGPKSKTMFAGDRVPSNAKNKENLFK